MYEVKLFDWRYSVKQALGDTNGRLLMWFLAFFILIFFLNYCGMDLLGVFWVS